MKRVIFSFVLILVVVGGHAQAAAEWEMLNSEVESLYQQGDYIHATSVA